MPTAHIQMLWVRQATCTHTPLLKTLVTDLPGRKTSPREAWASVQHPVYSSSRDSNTKNSSSKNRTVCQERQKSPQAKRFQVRPISHRDFGLCSPPPLSPVQSQPNKKTTRKQGRAVLVGSMCRSIGVSFMPLVKRFYLYSLPSEKTSTLMFWVAEDIRSTFSF